MSGLDIDHIADLKARNARLADALIECVEWLETRPDYTEGDAATNSSTRAALTADDRQAGEYLRALEAEHEAAVAANQAHEEFCHVYDSKGQDWAILMDAAHRLRDEKEDIWRAAVRAVEEKKNGTEESER